MLPHDPGYDADLAALAWQVDLGVDETIGETPIDRFGAASASASSRRSVPEAAQAARVAAPVLAVDGAGGASALAEECADLAALRAAIAGFEGCALKRGAKTLVFADGNPAARVMIVGEAPGREEDLAGLPFVGRSGKLLDRMLAAIGLSRRAEEAGKAVYIANVLPWRPPANRDPSSDEIAMMSPFLFRHIELAAPEMLVVMGNAAARTLLGTQTGITRLRGRWAEWRGLPVLPMFHPAALLRDPLKKRETWADLMSLRAALEGGGGN
jgi:uracil-DNA glycosylase